MNKRVSVGKMIHLILLNYIFDEKYLINIVSQDSISWAQDTISWAQESNSWPQDSNLWA